MDNSVSYTLLRKKSEDISDSGRDFSVPDDMGIHIVHDSGLRRSYKQSIRCFLSFYFTFMFDIIYINAKPEKQMTETKLGFMIAAWLAGFTGFSYTLLTIPWDNIKAIVLLVIGALWSLINACRAMVKLYKEYHDAKHHVKNLKK